jgi:TolB-like protein/Tfp pilus assembly protein PilF
MSDSGKAVFLSYASQDADAAKRICDALRAAGVEVWFDQSELVGGDQWDAKIRGQINSCALFVPLVSANTQARLEGYFRIEWKLAARRTHAMATAKAFLLPVVIDDTQDSAAHVPDEFREVQWTRMKGGETPSAFATRVKNLLGGTVAGVADPGLPGSTSPAKPRAGPHRQGLSKWWWVMPIFGVAMALILVMKEQRKAPLSDPATPAVAAAGSVNSDIAQLRTRLVPDRWQAGDFEAMAPSLERLTQANPDNVEAWALLSVIHSLQVTRNLDSGTRPLEQGKAAAERALRLAPNAPLAELAFGLHLTAMISRGGDVRAARPHIERGVAGLPRDALTRYAELVVYWLGYQVADAQRSARAWLADEPQASCPAWILAESMLATRQAAEAEKWAETAATNNEITGVRALVTRFEASYYLRADLTAARAALDRIPAGRQGVHRVVYARWLVAMAERRWDQALQELARVPEQILFDRNFHGPKALLAGIAHRAANRPEAARPQFQEAERLLREALVHDPENEELHAVLALTLAYAGKAAEAQGELAAVEPLLTGREPSHYAAHETALVAQTHGLLGDMVKMSQSLRWLFTNPSVLPLTPASVRLDPRFSAYVAEPPVAALLKEFASLDQAGPALAPSSPLPASVPPSVADAKSVAVLAFANLSDDKGNEYFSDGISEELLNVLAKIPGLKVSARTSAFYFKGKEVPVPEIARQLGVAYVVEGSVRKQGDKVRITAQLIKADGGFHVWSETFTRDLKDIFAVQDEIAGLIAKNLEVKMGIAAARPTVDLEAYQEFLAGRAAVAKAGSADLREAVGHFEKAVAIEPKFTAAWVSLASAHTRLGRWGGSPTLQAWQAARVAIDRARALEPDSPDVLLALGWILRTAEWDWRGAEQAFRRTLQLQPNQPDALAGAAVLLFNIGQTEEAYRLGQQAAQLDPLNGATQIDLSIMFYLNKNWAEAERAARRALQLAPGGTSYHAILAWGLIGQKRYDEAESELNLDGDRDGIDHINALGLLAIARGQGQVARDWLARLEEIARANGDRADLQMAIAWLCSSLGEKDRAFAALDRALISRDPSMSWLLNSWYLQPLFSDPRWPVLVRKVGLADDQLK